MKADISGLRKSRHYADIQTLKNMPMYFTQVRRNYEKLQQANVIFHNFLWLSIAETFEL
jgi:hypothetical protein